MSNEDTIVEGNEEVAIVEQKTEEVVIDKDGNELNNVSITFDEAAYKKGYLNPWDIKIRGSASRKEIIEYVEKWLNTSNPLVEDDPKLKDSFISFFCSRFKVDNKIFSNPKELESCVDNMVEKINGLADAKQQMVESTSKTIRNLSELDEESDKWQNKNDA